MTEHIILTREQVDKEFPVDPETGSRMKITSPGHAICPIELESGEFILPVAVLDDPKHTKTLDDLAVKQTDALDLRGVTRRREVTEAEIKKDPDAKAIEGGKP